MSKHPALVAIVLAGCLATAGASFAGGSGRAARIHGSITFTGGPGGVETTHTPRVYAVDANGRKLREVVVDADEAHWSPDGTRLAFLRARGEYGPGGTPMALVVMRADGTHRRVVAHLLRPDVVSDPNFSWSPDGKRIAYRDIVDRREVVFVVPVAGGRKVRLGEGERPIWSPDGKRIALLAGEGHDRALFVVRPDGSRRTQVTFGLSVFGLSPQSWSPDGRRIAFYPCCLNGFSIVDVDTGSVRSYLRGVAIPSWAPNGKWLAVSAAGTWLVRPSGTGLRRLTALGDSPFYPAWSPDSSTLAIEDRCCTPDVWTVPISGTGARRLTSGWRYGYGAYDPEWQPAGLATSKLAGRYVESALPTDSVAVGNELRATRPIRELVADGATVAIDYEQPNLGSETWAPGTSSVVRFKASADLGLADDRLAWVSGPHSQMSGDDWLVQTATVRIPRVDIVSGNPWGRTRPLSQPVGDGSLLAVSSWGPCRISVDPPCAHEPKTNGELYRIDGDHATRIASSPGPLTVVSVDSGRILVDHEDGSYDLLDATGSLLRSFTFNPAAVRHVCLQGRDLVVQTATAVEITDAATGTFVGRWPLPVDGARLVDVQDGVAVLVAGSDLHLLRLADGHPAVIRAPGTGVLAQLESSGLFYAYRANDRKHPGRIAFVPFDRLFVR